MHHLMFLPSIFQRLLTTEKNTQPRQEPNQNDKSKAQTEEIGTATNLPFSSKARRCHTQNTSDKDLPLLSLSPPPNLWY